jgi:hypothetical protein
MLHGQITTPPVNDVPDEGGASTAEAGKASTLSVGETFTGLPRLDSQLVAQDLAPRRRDRDADLALGAHQLANQPIRVGVSAPARDSDEDSIHDDSLRAW